MANIYSNYKFVYAVCALSICLEESFFFVSCLIYRLASTLYALNACNFFNVRHFRLIVIPQNTYLISITTGNLFYIWMYLWMQIEITLNYERIFDKNTLPRKSGSVLDVLCSNLSFFAFTGMNNLCIRRLM